MQDNESTMTSGLDELAQNSAPLLGLTILWHPDQPRIGQQWIGLAAPGSIELNRYAPLFRAGRNEGLPLGDRSITRASLQLRRDADDGIEIIPPQSRMTLGLNGQPLAGVAYLSRQQIDAGAVLRLGASVLLCLHWMRTLPRSSPIDGLLGVGSAAIRLRGQIAQVAATDLPVLLLGETGTGKEIAAQAIHAASKRAKAPLVSVNMAALNEALAAADLFGAVKGAYTGAQQARRGLFAEAQDGTLFLDEIGDTPPTIQPMLLRVLESGEYRPLGGQVALRSNARVIAATDQDLQARAFNQPLLRRLDAFVIRIAALRDRREDIGLLTVHFIRAWQHDADPALPITLATQLCLYHWPGNVRQLAHIVQRIGIALAAGESPSLTALLGKPAAVAVVDVTAAAPAVGSVAGAPARPRRKNLADLAPQEILDTMERHGWQIQASARALGISRPSLYKLLRAHPQIRMPQAIPAAELRAALKEHDGDLVRCASRLQTPSEALRRYLRAAGLLQ